MRISRPIAVTTLAAAALAGGLGGALLLGPASAHTSTETAVTAASGGAVATARCRKGFADLAEVIGISTDELRDALRDGQTLAEIADANGVDPQRVVDVLADNATERLDAAVAAGRIDEATAEERRASLADRAAELVNGELERDAHRHPRRLVAIRTAAEAIGIDASDLRDALREGQTIAEVAEADGVDPQAVIDALVARSTERITRVVNGDTVRQRC